MKERMCDACGKPTTRGGIHMGSAMICWDCEPSVREEMERLRTEVRPVNVLHIAKRMYRQEHSGGDYLLRGIPGDLWTKVKHRAVDEGCSLRELVLQALRAYLAG